MTGTTVTFTLNGIEMTGIVIREGKYNPDFVVVKVSKGKRDLECWVKKSAIK